MSYSWYMARFFDSEHHCWTSLLKNSASIEKKSCPGLLKDCTSNCYTIVPVSAEQSCQWLLNNLASDYWTMVPVAVEQWCQWLLKSYTSVCWRIAPVTVEESCQPPGASPRNFFFLGGGLCKILDLLSWKIFGP